MIELVKGSLKAELNQAGAHVDRILFSGITVIKESTDGHQTHGGVAPLIPYANRLKDGKYTWDNSTFSFPTGTDGNSIHGFGKDKIWEIVEQHSEKVKLYVSLEDRAYPFKVSAQMQFILSDTGFAHNIKFTNNGNKSAPLAPGFHPYFNTGNRWELKFQTSPEKVIKSDEFFPSGNFVQYHKRFSKGIHSFDTCFKYMGNVEIRGDELNFLLTPSNANYIMVYDGAYSENRSVAVEPMASGINAFNTGDDLKVLKPGESWNFGYNVEIAFK
jgi:Galactose mutarotase and related enzymes